MKKNIFFPRWNKMREKAWKSVFPWKWLVTQNLNGAFTTWKNSGVGFKKCVQWVLNRFLNSAAFEFNGGLYCRKIDSTKNSVHKLILFIQNYPPPPQPPLTHFTPPCIEKLTDRSWKLSLRNVFWSSFGVEEIEIRGEWKVLVGGKLFNNWVILKYWYLCSDFFLIMANPNFW